MPAISIRSFAEGDLAALAGLLTELGYPTTADQMRLRMSRIAPHPDHATFIAETGGRVVGMAGAEVAPSHEHDLPVGRITAMVVTETMRGTGAGAALVAAVEAWARGRGVRRITVTSHVRRAGAHAFYVRLGYGETGKRFAKELA